jgi:hypothetical protein
MPEAPMEKAMGTPIANNMINARNMRDSCITYLL